MIGVLRAACRCSRRHWSASAGEAIAEYADKLREGEQLDPALVFFDGTNYHLAAGFHRREAYRQAGKSDMPCYVSEGGEWDAIQAGIYDNQKHQGERLTLNDKRHNARLVLRRRPEMSDRMVRREGCPRHRAQVSRLPYVGPAGEPQRRALFSCAAGQRGDSLAHKVVPRVLSRDRGGDGTAI